jgi:transcriptional regulator with XRE-family HTH domain
MPEQRKRSPRRAQERGVSFNRVVAYRLRKAREARGWTQEQAAKELEPYVGKRWSKATWSAAESSYTASPDRVRIFSVDDLIGFARIFDRPVGWFLLPPATGDETPPWTPDLLEALIWAHPVAEHAVREAWDANTSTSGPNAALDAWHAWRDREEQLRQRAERVTLAVSDRFVEPDEDTVEING